LFEGVWFRYSLEEDYSDGDNVGRLGQAQFCYWQKCYAKYGGSGSDGRRSAFICYGHGSNAGAASYADADASSATYDVWRSSTSNVSPCSDAVFWSNAATASC
jgi:hypothetical protein